MFLGSICFVSVFVVVIRRHFFRRKLTEVVQNSASGQRALEDIEYQENKTSDNDMSRSRSNKGLRNRTSAKKVPDKSLPHRHSVQYGHGGFPAPWEISGLQSILKKLFLPSGPLLKSGQHSYLSFAPRLDSKGRVHALNEYERAELGGVEYRALGILLWALPFYQLFWMVIGALILVPYAYQPSMKSTIANAQPGNLNSGFFGFYLASTSFANCGLNPINANLVPFRGFYLPLIVAAVLTYAGNTQFPIYLRFGIWLSKKILPNKDSHLQQTLQFLLHHPRRCFVWLFPARETWILFAIQVSIELLLWVSFEVLNINLGPVTEAIPTRVRVFDSLFQSTGVRTSGAYIITISSLAPALLVIYLVFIYISSFPVILTLRTTNTYEERSVGLDPNHGQGGGLAMHLRNQLGYDIWFQLLAWFLICIIERPQITGGSQGFTLFALLFEVASGYGTVGLSTGVPYDDYSLSGQFHTLSKVIMLAVMLRGRHRGLPLAIDRSILVPGEDLMNKMDSEYTRYGEFSKEEEEQLRLEEQQGGSPSRRQ